MVNDAFDLNVEVPTESPLVTEYVLPEGDYAEKSQDVMARVDAARVSRWLLLQQFRRHRIEVERAIHDLEAEDPPLA